MLQRTRNVYDIEKSDDIKIEDNSVWLEEHICFINTNDQLLAFMTDHDRIISQLTSLQLSEDLLLLSVLDLLL